MANVPLETRSGGDALRRAFEDVWLPRLEAFRPQMLFISAGFDAHRADDMGGLGWSEADYSWITQALLEVADRHCGGRVVSSLEGGYELLALKRCVAAHVRELSGTA